MSYYMSGFTIPVTFHLCVLILDTPP